MRIALLLHIYQPPTQYENVFSDITQKCYKQLIRLLKKYPQARVTLNIPAALTEQFESYNYSEIIEDLKELSGRGQVELTGSAAYHPLLFRLPVEEIRRQIELDEQTNRSYFGDAWQPRGFFPPELAVDEQVLEEVESHGYNWILVEEKIREEGKLVSVEREDDKFRIYVRQGGKLKIAPRTRRLSLNIAFGKITTIDELLDDVRENFICENPSQIRENPILCMDGETFGWHQKEQLDLLEKIFAENSKSGSQLIELITVSELVDALPVGPEMEIEKSSWGKRVEKNGKVYYPRWENPENPVQKAQWELTDLAVSAVNSSKFRLPSTNLPADGTSSKQGDQALSSKEGKGHVMKGAGQGKTSGVKPHFAKASRGRSAETPEVGELAGLGDKEVQWLEARLLLDKAVHSDQYFWADEDVWHFGMVEKGARMLRDTILALPDKDKPTHKQSMLLYDKIVSLEESLYGKDKRG